MSLTSEPDAPTYEAFCADIRAARGTPLMLQLIADLKRLVKEGAFSGQAPQP